jgi:glycosyltransferase involved in cell wall biosynthesis
MNPLVSVIIPAYNAAGFIAETLESVLAQTYRPMEIIVVDDGSLDGTPAVVERFASQAVRLILQENAGPAAARNRGIAATSGTYIAFLDADDLWMPETVQKLVSYAVSNTDVSLVFGDSGSFGPEGVLFDSAFNKYGTPGLAGRNIVEKAFESLFEKGNFILTGTVLVERECLDNVGHFDERLRYAEDADLWVRIALFHKIGCVPEPLMMRRIHSTNTSKNEYSFITSKLYLLRKLQLKYPVELKGKNIDLELHVLKTLKGRGYFYYLKKDYKRSMLSYFYYLFYYVKYLFVTVLCKKVLRLLK